MRNPALVITDPQNNFLSAGGVTWGLVGDSVIETNTVANKGARESGCGEAEAAVFLGADASDSFERGAESERCAVADSLGDGADGHVWLAE